jgi:hypothetical protein
MRKKLFHKSSDCGGAPRSRIIFNSEVKITAGTAPVSSAIEPEPHAAASKCISFGISHYINQRIEGGARFRAASIFLPGAESTSK